MLAKLIKYEGKYIWKKALLINCITIAGTILAYIAFSLLSAGRYEENVTGILGIMCYLAYYAIVICSSFAMLIITGVRFYKNMYSDEGYITNTLPVTARQLHISKHIVYYFVQLISSFVMLFSILAVTESMIRLVESSGPVLFEDGSFLIADTFSEMLNISMPALFVWFLIFLSISAFCNNSYIFCAVVLGQYWKKHKVLGAIVSYIIITVILQIVSTVVSVPFIIANSLNSAGVNGNSNSARVMLLISIFITLVTGIIGYFIADNGIKNKLNLE